jgi:hypothetical protein
MPLASLMRASTVDGLLAKAKALKFAFPEDDAIAERLGEASGTDGPIRCPADVPQPRSGPARARQGGSPMTAPL